MEGQKSNKEIKVELLGYLGTLKDKASFCRKAHSSKHFLTIFNSLYKDPDFKDASETSEAEVLSAMLEKSDCPDEIVKAVLKMKPFEGQTFAYRSSHCSPKLLSSTLKKVIAEVKALKRGKEGMTQRQFDILTSLAYNQNLSRRDRLSLEKMCDLMIKNYDDGLLGVCVLTTKREHWLCEKFSEYVIRGNNNTILMNMCKNPLAKDHMIDYAARHAFSSEHAQMLVKHPNITPAGLEILKNRFPKMDTYISTLISGLMDEDEE